MKLISTALTLIIVALLAVWYLPAMYWGFQITQQVNKAQSGDNSAFAEIGRLSEGPPLIAWLRRNKAVNAAFNPTELTSDRYVSYKLEMPAEEILKPGETSPHPDFLELYAHARAPQIIMEQCDEVLTSLGTVCDVAKTNARLSRDGTVRISGRLHYVPSYPMGDPSGVRNGKLISASTRMIQGYDTVDTPEIRALVFQQSLDICAKLRAALGNCVVSSIRLDSDPRGDTNTLGAMASFEVYADATRFRRDWLQTEVDAIAESVLNGN